MRIINGYQFALCSYRLNKMADVSEHFSDTQGKPEATNVQVIIHKKKKKKRKYYYVSSTSDSWSNDLDCISSLTSMKKRRKRSVEATRKNKEIEK